MRVVGVLRRAMAGPSSMEGKTVLVTGATSGIGLETARELARRGAHVLLGARDRERGQREVDALLREGRKAELFLADMSSMSSVRGAAARVLEKRSVLDVLVNNAGVVPRKRRVTAEGNELTWATNLLGPFLLTEVLLPALRRAARPRVVNVSSVAHKHGRIAWEDTGLSSGYSGIKAYAQSKLALVLFTRELARREPTVASNAVHPGGIATNIWRDAPAPARWVLMHVLPSAEKGAQPLIHLAADPALDGVTGRYFDKMREVPPSVAAQSEADAVRLWAMAEAATRAGRP